MANNSEAAFDASPKSGYKKNNSWQNGKIGAQAHDALKARPDNPQMHQHAAAQIGLLQA